MFTICAFVFASLVSTEPTSVECGSTDKAGIAKATAACSALDKDPLTTCEVHRAGALKYFITIRQLDVA